MSSSKLTRVLAGAALLVFSAGCGSAESGQQTAMYADVSSSVASSTFELAEVSLGTISRNTSGEGVVIYPDSEYITCAGYEGTTLVQVNVKNGDSVEAGDVIAEFSRVYSQADLDTMYSDLSILKTQANIQRTALEQAVDRAEEQLAAAKTAQSDGSGSADDVKRAELLLEYAEIDYSSYVSSSNVAISAQQKLISDFEAGIANTKLIAKRSGVISDLVYLTPGSMVSADTIICTIYSPDVFWLRTSTDVSNTMRYNQTVSVNVTKEDTTYTGRIISSPNVLGQPTGQVIIQPLDFGGELAATFTDAMKRITVLAPRYELENVMVVPLSAVENEEGSRYVYVYEDGVAKKRYVTVGMQDTTNIQILDGLELGQTVVLG